MNLCNKFISALTIVFRFLKGLKALRNNTIYIIPDELLENILLRMALPPNSLANLGRVCKEWKLLIESPRFIECYHRQAQETNRDNQLVFVVSNQRVYTIELDKLGGRSLDIKEMNRALFKSLFPLAHGSRVRGSCNGMLCFTAMDGILVCDPSTRAYHRVPYPPSSKRTRTPRVKHMCYVMYGFGYDRSTYDYKIVRLIWDSAARIRTSEVDVYSLNKNSWKPLEGRYPKINHISAVNCSDNCVFVDNALHWLVTGRFDGQEAIECRILRFDLSSEEFSSLPWHGRMVAYCPTGYLDVLDGCLSTWFRRTSDDIEILIMNKYGMEESPSWTKLLTIQNDAAKIKLIALSEDGSRLLLAKYRKDSCQDTRFCWYDIDTSTKISEIQMQNLRKEMVFRVETSIQSQLTIPLDKLRNTRGRIPLSI